MRDLKDGIRSVVRVGYDDKIYKTFRGTDRDKRYFNEASILSLLEKRGCKYVPKLLDKDDKELMIVTSNCGQSVEKLSKEKMKSIFKDLEDSYGVRHGDQDKRNITYSQILGRFCVIDFELSEDVWCGKEGDH